MFFFISFRMLFSQKLATNSLQKNFYLSVRHILQWRASIQCQVRTMIKRSTWFTVRETLRYGQCFLRTRDSTPPPPHPGNLISSVYMWKRSPCRPSQSGPCTIIYNPFWIIKCTDIFLSFSFPRSLYRSGFSELIFTSLIWYEFLL